MPCLVKGTVWKRRSDGVGLVSCVTVASIPFLADRTLDRLFYLDTTGSNEGDQETDGSGCCRCVVCWDYWPLRGQILPRYSGTHLFFVLAHLGILFFFWMKIHIIRFDECIYTIALSACPVLILQTFSRSLIFALIHRISRQHCTSTQFYDSRIYSGGRSLNVLSLKL